MENALNERILRFDRIVNVGRVRCPVAADIQAPLFEIMQVTTKFGKNPGIGQGSR